MLACSTHPQVHLGLLHGRVGALPVHHAEGDALGVRGEHPADAGPSVPHGDADQTVAAALDEELSGAVPEVGDVVDAEGHGHAGERTRRGRDSTPCRPLAVVSLNQRPSWFHLGSKRRIQLPEPN